MISHNKCNRNNKITLFIHIGAHKTGSSIIQNFLDVNREILIAKHKCLYPNFSAIDITKGRQHYHIGWYRSIKDNKEKIFKELDRLMTSVSTKSLKKIILSAEGWDLDSEAIPFFERFYSYESINQIKIICYLRRIDSSAESEWKQRGLINYHNIEEFYKLPGIFNRYEYLYNHLKNWSDLIGKENVIVRPYEKQQLKYGLISDFLSQIGIDYSSHHWNETENTYLANNRGFSQEVLEILHLCRDLFTNTRHEYYFNLFSELLGDNFQKKPFESYNLLSPQQRIEIIENNSPYEKKIAKEFLNREDGKLFLNPLPKFDDPWEPKKTLSLEKIIPIIIKMIDENNKLIKSLEGDLT